MLEEFLEEIAILQEAKAILENVFEDLLMTGAVANQTQGEIFGYFDREREKEKTR